MSKNVMINEINVTSCKMIEKQTARFRFLYMVGLLSSVCIFLLEGKPEVYSTFAALFFCIFNTTIFLVFERKTASEFTKFSIRDEEGR